MLHFQAGRPLSDSWPPSQAGVPLVTAQLSFIVHSFSSHLLIDSTHRSIHPRHSSLNSLTSLRSSAPLIHSTHLINSSGRLSSSSGLRPVSWPSTSGLRSPADLPLTYSWSGFMSSQSGVNSSCPWHVKLTVRCTVPNKLEEQS